MVHVAKYLVAMRVAPRSSLAVLVMVVSVPLVSTASVGFADATTHSCHAPRVTGLTVMAARSRAASSGCRLRLEGSAVRMAQIQTIRAQRPGPGRAATLLRVTVNPLCPSSSNIGPPPGEPLETPGPTGLDTGLFIEGGAFIYRSAPNCKELVGKSLAGTITVINSAGTVVANNAKVGAGQLLNITLGAGEYTITGVVAGGNKVGPTTVTVPAGEVVRQDLALLVP